ncbi:uncharacterized protein LOC133527648 [Cydia pomonella]|uniref:uncharacterized protein LOC133527648 n=1 Tax=Cydia pomonella TaxID=82600 RepID=UPI002ADDB897|nr:uncharacterized protein LOC133527648 [Cydia pomonella]
MAVDMQMTAVGLGVFFLLKRTKARLAAIVLSVAAGVATPAMATYYNNVHPIMVLSPEATVNWFVHDPTFNYLYKRGHTNLIGYALGWALGYVVFNLRNSDVGAKKYKKYGVLVWLILPSVLAINTIGAVFYDHTVTVPLYACAIYAGLTKLITGLLFSLALFLTIVKANKLRTKLYCWQGWTPLARLSFCLYMVQMTVLRYRSASTHTMYHKSEFKIFQNFLETTFVSCLISVLLFLTVEAPFARLTRLGLAPAQKKHAD